MTDNKKIILIGPAYPYRGGNSLFVSHVYDILKDKFNVKLINYSLLYPSFLFPGSTQYDKSSETIKKAPSERLLNSINPFSWIRVANKIKKENPDLVVFDWWHPFFSFAHYFISSFLGNKYKNRILFITENVISHEANIIDRILTKLGLKNASSFLALSNKVEEELKYIRGKRKVYRSELPNYDCYDTVSSINNSKEELGYSPSKKIILFFGYIRKYKGLDILIKAFSILCKKHNDVELLIVGESYDQISEYTDLIEREGIKEKVKLINIFVPNEEVGKYYNACDVVVLPYRSATQSGILNVAYGFQKPVIVTDVGGLAEFVETGKTGFVVKPEDPEALASSIDNFFVIRDSINFKENIQNYTNNNQFNKLPELFNQIINDSIR